MPREKPSLKEKIRSIERKLEKSESKSLRGTGLRFVGCGVSRMVYVHKDYPDVVFKVQPYGASANRSEALFYKKAKKSQKNCLCPIIAHSPRYVVLVMEKLKVNHKVATKKIFNFIRKIRSNLPPNRRWDCSSCTPQELKKYNKMHLHNIGVDKLGELKLYDFTTSGAM